MNALTPNARPCGKCAMCCRLPAIEQLDKPAGQWCKHWKKGTNCTIYTDRPEVCRKFYCLWNLGLIPEELYPHQTRVVLAIYDDVLVVYCHPDYPHAWEEGKMGEYINQWEGRFIVQTGEHKQVIIPVGGDLS